MNKQMINSEVQQNVDRLCQIIANYVGVYDIGYDALDALSGLCSVLGAHDLEKFWDERFTRAMKNTRSFK